MLTPQEVSERAFPKASFGGYNMALVDEFLDQLTDDYTTLFKENAGLKSKMKVLVDKVEEYRTTEEAMRKALMAAQQTADQMIAEAEAKRDQIEADAEAQVRSKVEGYRREIDAEETRLAAAKVATADYVNKMKALLAQETTYLSNLEEVAPVAAPIVAPVLTPKSELEDTKDLAPKKAEAPIAETPETPEAPEKPGGLYQDLTGFGMHTPKKPESDVAATRTMPPIQDRDYQIK